MATGFDDMWLFYKRVGDSNVVSGGFGYVLYRCELVDIFKFVDCYNICRSFVVFGK